MSGICTILAGTRKVIRILGMKSEGNVKLRRHARRWQVTIKLITGFCEDENKLFI
jgi:hypothetical protein